MGYHDFEKIFSSAASPLSQAIENFGRKEFFLKINALSEESGGISSPHFKT